MSLYFVLISLYSCFLLTKVNDLQHELDVETKRSSEAQKLAKKYERRLKEMALQTEEHEKNVQTLKDNNDRLNKKIKNLRQQLEDAVSPKNTAIKGQLLLSICSLFALLSME